MRMFDIMILLVLIGSVGSSLNYIMTLGDDWTDGYSSPDLTTVSVVEGDIQNFDVKNVSASANVVLEGFSAWNLLTSAISGVFYMDDMMGKILHWETEMNPETNLFKPILSLLQGVINLIVIFGIYQGVTGRTTKHME